MLIQYRSTCKQTVQGENMEIKDDSMEIKEQLTPTMSSKDSHEIYFYIPVLTWLPTYHNIKQTNLWSCTVFVVCTDTCITPTL